METKTIEEKLTFTCPECSAHLKVPIRLAGVTGPCPKCGETITAPEGSEEPQAPKSTKTFASLRGAPSRPSIQPLNRDPRPREEPRPRNNQPAPSPDPIVQPTDQGQAPETTSPAPVGTTPKPAEPSAPKKPTAPKPSPAPVANAANPQAIGANSLLPSMARIPQGPQSTLFMATPRPAAPRPNPVVEMPASAEPAPAPESKKIAEPEKAVAPETDPALERQPAIPTSPPLAVESQPAKEPSEVQSPSAAPEMPAAEPVVKVPDAIQPEASTTGATPVSLPRPRKLTPPAAGETPVRNPEPEVQPAQASSQPAANPSVSEPARMEKTAIAAPKIDRTPQPAPSRQPGPAESPASAEDPRDPVGTAPAPEAPASATASPQTSPASVAPPKQEEKPAFADSFLAEDTGTIAEKNAAAATSPAPESTPAVSEIPEPAVNAPVKSDDPEPEPTAAAPTAKAEPEKAPDPEEARVPTASITMPHFAVDGFEPGNAGPDEFIAPAPSASPQLPAPKNGSDHAGQTPPAADESTKAGPVLLPEPRSDRLGVANRKSLFTIKPEEDGVQGGPEAGAASPLSSGPPISHLDSVLPEDSVFTPKHQDTLPAGYGDSPLGAAAALGLAPATDPVDSPIPQPAETELDRTTDSEIDVEALFGKPEAKTNGREKSRSGAGRFLTTAAVMIVTGLSVAFIGELFGAWSVFGGGDATGDEIENGGTPAVARGPEGAGDGTGPNTLSTRNMAPPFPATTSGETESPAPINPGGQDPDPTGASDVVTGNAEDPSGLVITDTSATGNTGENPVPETAGADTGSNTGDLENAFATGTMPEGSAAADTIVFPTVDQLPEVTIPDEDINIFASAGGGETTAPKGETSESAVESVAGESPAPGISPDAMIGPPGPAADPSVGGESAAVARPGEDPKNGYDVVAAIGEGVATPPVPPVVAASETPGNPPVEAIPETATPSGAGNAAFAEEEGDLGESRAAIHRFLQAQTWQERLPHIYAAEILKDKIAAYYQEHPDKAITDYHLKYLLMDENPVDGDFPLYVFFVIIPDEDGEFPITVRNLPDGKKIDWEAFVEFHDRAYGKFLESGATGPQNFRVILERQSYWGADRNKMNDYLSYHVESPDPEYATHAFVPANTVLSAQLEKYFSWGAGPIATTVEMERQEMPHGESHYIINRLVTDPEASDGWHVKPGSE